MPSTPDISPPDTPDVRLVQLPVDAIHALAAGDLATANRTSPVVLTPYFAGPDWGSVWSMRSAQVRTDPASAGWITRVILDVESGTAVGRAGFHGPPDDLGMLEVGYAVDPAWRRRGYARAALEALLDRAAREPSVSIVRATITPDNLASRALVARYGFVEVGEQWDDEDGLETIFEVPAARSALTR
ncbi:GNAT family N-acetyltransferase [Sanguibacter antarcticus]|uniref:RimJ/RimL family protein N-acetyltransferase n=1 Tax=Sanguibacter antarcticus TaxID=372484 RepID=A0A2A9E6X9_9MICO|nr:GNAT family protein [Sanguibacter antarcticus]PFG34301.1 RimJ/RimL family protein N-acetyltransferase [Sanguibacter antarcticus]